MKQLPQPVAIAVDVLFAPVLLCAVVWVRARQSAILRAGVALSPAQIHLVRTLGVAAAGRVRVMPVDAVPMPLPRWALAMAHQLGLISPHIVGMTLGYGIVLRADCCGVGGFLRQYVRECVWPGYPRGALEIEAKRAEASAEAGVLRAGRM